MRGLVQRRSSLVGMGSQLWGKHLSKRERWLAVEARDVQELLSQLNLYPLQDQAWKAAVGRSASWEFSGSSGDGGMCKGR